VRLTRPYYLGKYETTQEQYEKVIGKNPSIFRDNKRNPVEQMSFDNAQAFARQLTELFKGKAEFRLPTEAEWEHACRAGTATAFYFGEKITAEQANYNGEFAWDGAKGPKRGRPAPVGGYPPNPWGLYDMAGNLWEYCEDWDGPYGKDPQTDPKGPGNGAQHVMRGGSWYGQPGLCRSAARYYFAHLEPTARNRGFRVLMVVPARGPEAAAPPAGGDWKTIAAKDIQVKLQGQAAASVDKDVLSVTVPQGGGNHAAIPLLAGAEDFRLRFEYRGPVLEMFLRRANWRGCLLVLLAEDAIRVRTYPDDDPRKIQVLTDLKRKGLLADDWHSVEITLAGSSFLFLVDGKAVSQTESLPVVTRGDSQILVFDTRGGSFQLRNLAVSVQGSAQPVAAGGTLTGILVQKDQTDQWIEVQADGQTTTERYLPPEAGGQPDPNVTAAIKKLIVPNLVKLAWKLDGGGRRIVSVETVVPAEKAGGAAGKVVAKGNSWIDLKPDDGGPVERYWPRWLPGGPDQPIVQAIARLNVGDRVKIGWIYDLRKRVVRIEPAS